MPAIQSVRMNPQTVTAILGFFTAIGLFTGMLLSEPTILITLVLLGSVLAITYMIFYLTLAVEKIAYDN